MCKLRSRPEEQSQNCPFSEFLGAKFLLNFTCPKWSSGWMICQPVCMWATVGNRRGYMTKHEWGFIEILSCPHHTPPPPPCGFVVESFTEQNFLLHSTSEACHRELSILFIWAVLTKPSMKINTRIDHSVQHYICFYSLLWYNGSWQYQLTWHHSTTNLLREGRGHLT